jgi:hypothetical protein
LGLRPSDHWARPTSPRCSLLSSHTLLSLFLLPSRVDDSTAKSRPSPARKQIPIKSCQKESRIGLYLVKDGGEHRDVRQQLVLLIAKRRQQTVAHLVDLVDGHLVLLEISPSNNR